MKVAKWLSAADVERIRWRPAPRSKRRRPLDHHCRHGYVRSHDTTRLATAAFDSVIVR
jgi:hypothetical protein